MTPEQKSNYTTIGVYASAETVREIERLVHNSTMSRALSGEGKYLNTTRLIRTAVLALLNTSIKKSAKFFDATDSDENFRKILEQYV